MFSNCRSTPGSNPNAVIYPPYGCMPQWGSNPTAFYEWALQNGYAENLLLDRKENHHGSSPENCGGERTSKTAGGTTQGLNGSVRT
jgi:hypothetical protein